MKRDIATFSLTEQEELVITADNSGSIGMKPSDDVKVPYDVVSYFSFRVAYMECVAAGGTPLAVILHNFSGDEAWAPLVTGIKRGMKELGITLEITGSTETNFPLKQSATGLLIIGRRRLQKDKLVMYSDELEIGVIGQPLVGEEVIKHQEAVVPLSLFQIFVNHDDVVAVMPVGSKGILYELNVLFDDPSLTYSSTLDLKKSSGPATCFIIVCKKTFAHQAQKLAGDLWFNVFVT